MQNKKQRIAYYIAFLIGTVAFFFSSGHWNIAIASWIWPMAYLYCVRSGQGRFTGLKLYFVMWAAMFFKWCGITDSGAVADLLDLALLTLILYIPLLVERLLSKKKNGDALWRSSARLLVYPAMYTGLTLLSFITPFSDTTSLAYSQCSFFPVARLSSVIGIFGIAFLMLWFASLAERWVHSLISGEQLPYLKKASLTFAVIFLCIALMSSVTALLQPAKTDDSIRVALAVGAEVECYEDGSYEQLSLDENLASLEKTMDEAARDHAEVLAYNEEAYAIQDTELQTVLHMAQEKAREAAMYIFLPLEIYSEKEEALSRNCMYLIAPDGSILWDYTKVRLVPILEEDFQKGENPIPITQLSFPDGRSASAAACICYDADSPIFVNKIPSDVELLFVSSWDWKDILTYHSPALTFRAMEHGATLIKPTYDGISCVADRRGNWLHSFNSFETGCDHVEIAEVPINGGKTLYATVFHYFDLLYLFLPIALLLLTLVRRSKKNIAS